MGQIGKNGGDFADSFELNARPTVRGIVDSLKILRSRPQPFAAHELSNRLDLLMLPALVGVPTLDERVKRLQTLLRRVADDLKYQEEICYRHIYLDPEHQGLGDRRDAAFDELPKEVGFRTRETSATVNKLEERMLVALAEALLGEEGDDLGPVQTLSASPSLDPRQTRAFYVVTSSMDWEISDDDPRRSRIAVHDQLEARAPDIRVAHMRYFSKASDPMPVKDSVSVMSPGHTYLGTFPDGHSGAVGDWFNHFIHLGQRLDPGDTTSIKLSYELYDEQMTDEHPSLTITLDNPGCTHFALGIKLPAKFRAGVAAEQRTIRNPHSDSYIVSRSPVRIDRRGWLRMSVDDPEPGHQYGIFLPGVNLYK